MLAELLPSPDLHSDWRSFARALIAALDNLTAASTSTAEVTYVVSTTPIDPTQLPPLPANYLPLWLNSVDAQLYLGNTLYDPPTGANIVFIDTANIANAAINVNKLADGAVTSAKILNATIGSADIGNAAILTALIADAQIVNAKIADLAVNTAKIANLAVTSAQIANLAVGSAHIQAAAINTAHIGDAQITNAKIGNVIQSASWNPATKQGWSIDKTGLIQGSGLAIYDTSGNLVFGSGGTVAWTAITGSGKPADNATVGAVIGTNLSGQMNSGNISTFIAGAAIGTALIANSAIGTAQIADAAILAAKIADAQIITAKIADAAITSAKILNLVIDKVTAGTLNAVIDMGTGLIRFTIGGNTLTLGKGFGTSNQFIMWFGPTVAESAMNEAAAIFYLKTDGSAYFGGSLLAGTIQNAARTTSTSATAQIETGNFGSNGNPRVYTVGYQYQYTADWTFGGGNKTASTPQATIVLEKQSGASWVQLGSIHVPTGSNTITQATGTTDGHIDSTIFGSFQYTDNSGGTGPINVRARMTARTDPNPTPNTNIYSSSMTQTLSINSVEQ